MADDWSCSLRAPRLGLFGWLAMGKWLEPVRRPALVTQMAGGGDLLNCQTRHLSRSVTVRRQSGSKEFRGEALQRHTACPHCSVLLPTILHWTLRLSVYGGDLCDPASFP